MSAAQDSRVHHRAPVRRRVGRPAGGELVADREQLLQAAERTIRAAGPTVSMQTIAEAAGVTKPILYRSVGDRDAVISALAERFVQRINTAAAEAMQHASGRRDALQKMVSAYVDVVADDQQVFLFVTAGGNDDRLGRALRLADRSAGPIAAQLSALPRGTGRTNEATHVWAYGLIGALQYATLWWLREHACTADELAEHLTDLLWDGIGGRQP